MNHLVLLEHAEGRVKRSALAGVALARALGGEYALLLVGSELGRIAESVQSYGAARVWLADHPLLAEPLADRYAAVIAQVMGQISARTLIGTSSTFAKDVLPRAAALLDAPMVTEVMAVEQQDGAVCYRRPIQAGSLIATVRIEGPVQVLSARGTAFAAPASDGNRSPVERLELDPQSLPSATRFVSRQPPQSARPDLNEARVVVSGGRPLNDAATFERLIGGLADALGGAVAATRAAVDAGMAPNDCQVGQTGKVVAPDLYLGVGVSGAIQHMAGIQDSRVIVAINRDPEAPVFQSATYGLIGDLHQIVPELIKALQKNEERSEGNG